jgi:SPP1 family predicted phage head-tail adaptor
MPKTFPCDPGERDRSVTIQTRTAGQDGAGFPVETWATLATCAMRIAPLSGRERFQQAQTSAAADTEWEMGYRADMDPELVDVTRERRLLYQGRDYDIMRADLIGRRAGVLLTTLAKVG